MKTLKIGILQRDEYQKRVLDIAAGRYKPKQGEPKVFFSSIKSLGEVLSENNVRLLKLMDEERPRSIKELSELSGRHVSNLSRTLKTLERYGIVKLVNEQRAVRPVAQATDFTIYYAA